MEQLKRNPSKHLPFPFKRGIMLFFTSSISSLCFSFQAWRILLSNNEYIHRDHRLYTAWATLAADFGKAGSWNVSRPRRVKNPLQRTLLLRQRVTKTSYWAKQLHKTNIKLALLKLAHKAELLLTWDSRRINQASLYHDKCVHTRSHFKPIWVTKILWPGYDFLWKLKKHTRVI